MRVTAALFVAVMAVTSISAAAIKADDDPYHNACFAPEGPCTKLDQAISAANGFLASPEYGSHDANSKSAEEYLKSVINEVSAPEGTVTKRAPMPRNMFCPWVGAGCRKVRRSAEAINDILGNAELQKRWAEPNAEPWRSTNMFCPFVGAGCKKARRSIDTLLDASKDILDALSKKE